MPAHFTNDQPSGNREWERFSIGSGVNQPVDMPLGPRVLLPAGLYDVQVTGLDMGNLNFLNSIWTNEMKRPDSPPLKIVVDDGAHIAEHMAQTVFFWFPRIQPRGLLIVEDIQPISEANAFRTQFLPQIMKDLHFCGDPKQASDELCL